MKRIAVKIVVAAAVSVLVAGDGYTAPEPSEAKVKWELDFRFDPVRPIRVQLVGRKEKQTFWYMLYTVTNRTGKEQSFVPDFDLYTDTGQLVHSGRKTPRVVYNAIKSLHNAPLLKNMPDMTGRILQGEDNAKDSVAIWHDFDPKAGSFDVFIGSLSGEVVEVKLPWRTEVIKVDAKGEKKVVVQETLLLAKTLQLTYKIPGEAAARVRTPTKLAKKKWIMR
jgi:hypothetical protein